MKTKTRELITWAHNGEWSSSQLAQRPDGLWRYEQHSQYQGSTTGRVVIIEAPAGLVIEDEADLDTNYNGAYTKAQYLMCMGREVRCIRRGYKVQ